MCDKDILNTALTLFPHMLEMEKEARYPMMASDETVIKFAIQKSVDAAKMIVQLCKEDENENC